MFREQFFRHRRPQLRARPQKRSARPVVEQLEDRVVPTVYTVNTVADFSAANAPDTTHLSLREALQAANTNAPVIVNNAVVAQAGSVDSDSIVFDHSLSGNTTIALVQALGQLQITDDV